MRCGRQIARVRQRKRTVVGNSYKILQKAREQGLVGEDETPPDEQVYDWIFQAGFES